LERLSNKISLWNFKIRNWNNREIYKIRTHKYREITLNRL